MLLSSNATRALSNGKLATITVAGYNPTGNAGISINGGPETPVALSGGTGVLPLAGGAQAGTYTVVFSYAGDANNNPAQPQTIVKTIAKATSSVNVGVAPTNPVAGQPLSLNAFVSGYNVSGTVVFNINGTDFAAVGVLGGVGVYPFPQGAPAGTYTVIATYSGDSNNLGSTSNPFVVTVQ